MAGCPQTAPGKPCTKNHRPWRRAGRRTGGPPQGGAHHGAVYCKSSVLETYTQVAPCECNRADVGIYVYTNTHTHAIVTDEFEGEWGKVDGRA